MSSLPSPGVLKQIMRARRRMFLQTLVDSELACLAWSLGFCVLWFLLQPLFLKDAAEWLRPGIAGGAIAIGLVVGFVLAWMKSPSPVDAALALDKRFGLKERVTTTLLLDAEQLDGAAGQALVTDVERRVAGLHVPDRFGVQLKRSRVLFPLAAGALAVLTFFVEPNFNFAGPSRPRAGQKEVVNVKEIEDQLEKIKKITLTKKEETPDDKKLKDLEAEWDKIVKQPIDPNNKEQIRELAKDLRNIQDQLKDRINDLKAMANQNKDLKKELERLGLMDKDKKIEPPLRDFADALRNGEMAKAAEMIDRLMKDLKDKKLSKEEQKKLADQLNELKDRLERLVDQKEQKDKLKKDFEQGKITKEELDREMEKLNQQKQEMAELEELAKLLQNTTECLGQGL